MQSVSGDQLALPLSLSLSLSVDTSVLLSLSQWRPAHFSLLTLSLSLGAKEPDCRKQLALAHVKLGEGLDLQSSRTLAMTHTAEI